MPAHKWKLDSVFESWMSVESGKKHIFDTGLLNHIIQYDHEEDQSIKTERLNYRVIIEIEDKENDHT